MTLFKITALSILAVTGFAWGWHSAGDRAPSSPFLSAMDPADAAVDPDAMARQVAVLRVSRVHMIDTPSAESGAVRRYVVQTVAFDDGMGTAQVLHLEHITVAVPGDAVDNMQVEAYPFQASARPADFRIH